MNPALTTDTFMLGGNKVVKPTEKSPETQFLEGEWTKYEDYEIIAEVGWFNFIQDLARRQADAGAFWLDVNAGTLPEHEPDNLAWLVRTVQKVVDLPLCLRGYLSRPTTSHILNNSNFSSPSF